MTTTQKTKQDIINDISEHIRKEGSGPSRWYVGISEDARDRLFNQHGVSEQNGRWIYRTAASSAIVREIEEYFVQTMGTDGGTGGGTDASRQVYAYKKTTATRQ